MQNFGGCKHVLDVACGPGVFLELLKAAEINATGIDADPKVVQFAQSKGCYAVQSDIVEYLENTSERFDGVFCSHVIEHLPFEAVLRVIQGAFKCIGNEGILYWRSRTPERSEPTSTSSGSIPSMFASTTVDL